MRPCSMLWRRPPLCPQSEDCLLPCDRGPVTVVLSGWWLGGPQGGRWPGRPPTETALWSVKSGGVGPLPARHTRPSGSGWGWGRFSKTMHLL